MESKNMQQVIDKLNPYMDKIFCSPLSQEEITHLEQKLNLQLPEYFKIYLRNIGFLQDLIWDNIFTTNGEYYFEKEFINTNCSKGADYFAFAHNGSGDLFLLRDGKHKDDTIYKLYHDNGKIVKTKKTFISYVDKAIDKAIQKYKKLKYNKDKLWKIQLLFRTYKEKEIISIFQNVWDVQEPKEWLFDKQYPSGVISYTKSLLINGNPIELDKSTYKDWETPSYAINFEIHVIDKTKCDEIKKLDLLFKQAGDLNYKLLSYGVF